MRVEGADPVAYARQLANVLIRQPSLHRRMQFFLLLSDRDILQRPAVPNTTVPYCLSICLSKSFLYAHKACLFKPTLEQRSVTLERSICPRTCACICAS